MPLLSQFLAEYKMEDKDKTKEQLISELGWLRQRIYKLETELRIAAALSDIVQTAGEATELGDLLNRTLGKLVEMTRADMGMVYLLDLSKKALLLKVYRGLSEQVVRRISDVKYSNDEFRKVPGWNLKDMSFSDLFGEATLRLIATEMKEEQPQSLAAIPFAGKSSLQGVMLVASRNERNFSQDDLNFLEAAGKQIGLGIENSMLLQDVGKLTTIDSLTGLYNQSYFKQRLYDEVRRSSRYGLRFTIIMLHIDEFERYISRAGNASDRETMEILGLLCRECSRNTDISCRYDEGKFAIILPHTNSNGAQVVAKRLQQRVRDVFALESRYTRFNVTLSLGIASFPDDAVEPEPLIKLAEVASATAIQQGGNKVCLASDITSAISAANSNAPDLAANMETLSMDNVYALALAVDAKNSSSHSRDVAKQAVATGKVLGLSSRNIRHLHSAAFLHDIGKANLSDSVAPKSSLPDEDKHRNLQKHPELGATITSKIPELEYCAKAIRHHHERYDGSGYPDGLQGNQIPIEARIIAVADAYANMTAPSPSGQILSSEEALEKLKQNSNSQFDPNVVLAFIKAMTASA